MSCKTADPGPTRAVVVDDSSFMRAVIGDILRGDDIDVIAEAGDGAAAVEAVAEHQPDVVTMDIQMPGVSGVEAVERIMATTPTPIITDGARIGGGEALVAKGGAHMVVRNDAGGRLRVTLTDDPPEHNVRPAIDATMRSAVSTIDGPLTGVVLTGMGRDGAAGIEAISAAGGRTIAQNEASSTVYGMPRRAVETGAVDTVAGIEELTEAIIGTISEGAA